MKPSTSDTIFDLKGNLCFMETAVIVYGTARSGTSMTCGVLDRIGVKIIHDPDSEHQLEQNPTGAYEYDGIMEIGRSIDESINKKISCLPAHNLIKNSILSRRPKEGLWGFKSPGIYCIPMLKLCLNEIKIVMTTRNIYDQACSFQNFRHKLDNIESDIILLMDEMARNMTSMLSSIRGNGLPIHFVTYEGLRGDTRREVGNLASFLGIELTDEMWDNIFNYIKPNMHTWER